MNIGGNLLNPRWREPGSGPVHLLLQLQSSTAGHPVHFQWLLEVSRHRREGQTRLNTRLLLLGVRHEWIISFSIDSFPFYELSAQRLQSSAQVPNIDRLYRTAGGNAHSDAMRDG